MNTKESTCVTLMGFARNGKKVSVVFRSANLFFLVLLAVGCVHYPVNPPLKQAVPAGDYRGEAMGSPEKSGRLLMLLTFSGGGTRAAAFSYGVLEELKKTEVTIDGKNRRLLDEINAISSVSGGSFTAGYYGLFGDRIFEDFDTRFLKKNIEGALIARTFFNPINRFRLLSPDFGRSDLAAEYYDKHVFDGKTFGDIEARKGPVILMNATDMTHGTRIAFAQEAFNLICSDLSKFSVARAAAASSAVPMLLTPITVQNYAGTCGYKIPARYEAALKGRDINARQFYLANNIRVYLDSEKKPYIHLVDGGVADNLGLRAILDRVILKGSVWEAIKGTPMEGVRKIVFIIVNAETEPDTKWDRTGKIPSFGAMLSAYSGISIERYNEETIALLKESVGSWVEDIKTDRCNDTQGSMDAGSCGDIQFYVVEVKFDALRDEAERNYFKRLPTSFKLTPEQVDKLRDAAHRILIESEEFKRLLSDLK